MDESKQEGALDEEEEVNMRTGSPPDQPQPAVSVVPKRTPSSSNNNHHQQHNGASPPLADYGSSLDVNVDDTADSHYQNNNGAAPRRSSERLLSEGDSRDHFVERPPRDRRPSISERRNFHTPLSAPPAQHHHQNRAMRKTSLPSSVPPRPTGLQLQPSAADGEGPSVWRAGKRHSESTTTYPIDETSGLGETKKKMPKSVSDYVLGANRRPSMSSGAGMIGDSDSLEGLDLLDVRSVVHGFVFTAHQRDVEQQLVMVVPVDDGGEQQEIGASPLEAPSATASATAMTGIISTPDLPLEFQRSPLSPTAEVGRRLALLAAEFDQRYGGELDDMARMVLPHILGQSAGSSQSSSGQLMTFQVFRNVAKRLFEGHEITWGRIVALLTFGYRLVLSVLRAGLKGFVDRIVDFVCKFIVVEPIARWISRQGGWEEALRFRPASDNPQLRAVVEFGYWTVQALAVAILAFHLFKSSR